MGSATSQNLMFIEDNIRPTSVDHQRFGIMVWKKLKQLYYDGKKLL